jgi:hypothetical protein
MPPRELRSRFVLATLAFALLAGGGLARAKEADEKTKGSDEKAEGSGDETESPREKSGDQKDYFVGADLEVVVPLGDMADVTGPQLGPLLRVGWRISPAVWFCGRIGYLGGLKKSQTTYVPTTVTIDQSITSVPIWLGVRLAYPNEVAGPYVSIDAAAFNILAATATASPASVNSQTSSSSNANHATMGFNFGFGYVLSPKIPIDIAAQVSYFNAFTFGDSGDKPLLGVGFSVGYALFF